ESASGTRNLRASLVRVLEHQRTDVMAIQKYDIRRPPDQGGGFEERFWTPTNQPVFDSEGHMIAIIHRVEDVTDFMQQQRRGAALDTLASELRRQNEQMTAELFRHEQEAKRALLKSQRELESTQAR